MQGHLFPVEAHLVEDGLALLKVLHHLLPALGVGIDAPHAQQRLQGRHVAGAVCARIPCEGPCTGHQGDSACMEVRCLEMPCMDCGQLHKYQPGAGKWTECRSVQSTART